MEANLKVKTICISQISNNINLEGFDVDIKLIVSFINGAYILQNTKKLLLSNERS